jgi:hypothetical protein
MTKFLPSFSILTRSFSSTHPALQRPDHALYPSIDWEIIGSGKYAVVDPLDPHSIKYLSNREYIIDSRVAMSNDISLVVLATPKDHPIPFIRSDPSDPKNSPPEGEEDIKGHQRFESRSGRINMLRYMFTTPFLTDLMSEPKGVNRKAANLKRRKAKEWAEQHLAKDASGGVSSNGCSPSSDSNQKKRSPELSNSRSKVPLDTLCYLEAAGARGKERKEVVYEPMIVLNRRNMVKIILKWGKILHFRLFGLAKASEYERALTQFANHLFYIFEHNGVQQVILRLKVYLHVILSYLSGSPLKTTRPLKTAVRLTNGLPSCLPASTRHAIRQRSIASIRLWTSLCGMYKGLKGVWGLPDYQDVIQPDMPTFGNLQLLKFREYCKNVYIHTLPRKKTDDRAKVSPYPHSPTDLKTTNVYVSAKGGPNGPSLISSHWDLVAWLVIAGHKLGYFKNKKILISVHDLALKTHPFKEFIFWVTLNLDEIFKFLPWARLMLHTKDIRLKHAITKMIFSLEDLDLTKISDTPGNPITSGFVQKEQGRCPSTGVLDRCPPEFEGVLEPLWCRTGPQGGLNVAQLVSLYEPAGKIRNIVMVDWVSQQVLDPFHRLLFFLLRRIPTDATFDQEGSVLGFCEKNLPYVASFDLKAATETISRQLYEVVLEPLLGVDSTALILEVLIDRSIAICPTANKAVWGSHIRYNRGQPMGALGSWASMALVHHALVQFSAYSCGQIGDRSMVFTDYLVLGDDIVIGNQEVADSYLRLCGDLGVTIGLPKSFISNEGFFNFAAQSFFSKQNISTISFKEELSARTPGTRIESALRLIRRGYLNVSEAGWLAPLLRAVLPKQVYKPVMVSRCKGVLDPAVRAVLAATSGVLSKIRFDEFTKTGMEALQGLSVWGYLRMFKSGVSLFSEPLLTTLTRGPGMDKDPGLDEAVMNLVINETKLIYDQFLKIHPTLLRWKEISIRNEKGRILNPELLLGPTLQYLAPILVSYPTLGTRMDELLEWETKYRRILKTVLVAGNLQPITLELFEYTVGPLEDLLETLDSARRELPFNPEMVLGGTPNKTSARPDTTYQDAAERFSRFAHLVELSNAASYEPAFSRRYSSVAPDFQGVFLEPWGHPSN